MIKRLPKLIIDGRSKQFIESDKLYPVLPQSVARKEIRGVRKVSNLVAAFGYRLSPLQGRVGIQGDRRRHCVLCFSEEHLQLARLLGQLRNVDLFCLAKS